MEKQSSAQGHSKKQWGIARLIGFGLLLIALSAMMPFLQGKMPDTADGILHLYRVIALDHSLGVDHPIWPRYSSGLVYGYGASLFNYFSPASYYPAVWLKHLGWGYQDAFLLMMAFYTYLSAVGAYLLGSLWAGRGAGFLTAIAYVYSPYFLFDTVIRGTSSEIAALALLPFALWALTRLAFIGQKRDFVLAILFLSLFIIMHNIISLHGSFLIALYCLLLWLTSADKSHSLGRLVAAGLIGLMMTAFFWLPALGESSYTRLSGVAENLSSIDVSQSLRQIGDLLALPFQADTSQMQQAVPISLGWIQILLGLSGLVLVWWTDRKGLKALLSLSCVFVIGIGLINLEGSEWIWENVPLLGFSQFAWRTLGLPSLMLALMAGVGAMLISHRIPNKWLQIGLVCVFGGGMMVYGMPWLYRPYLADIEAKGIEDTQAFERESGLLTLSSYSEYLPAWTDANLDKDRFLEQNGTDVLFERLSLPEGVVIESAEWGGTWANLNLSVEQAQTLIFDWLYMPGWTVRLSSPELEARLYPQTGDGRIAVDVPAGAYTLAIAYEGSDLQRLSGWVWIGAWFAMGLVLMVGWRWIGRMVPPQRDRQWVPDFVAQALLIAMPLLGLSLFGLKALVLDQVDSPLHRQAYQEGVLAGFENESLISFEGGLSLLGIRIEGDAARLNRQVKSYWALSDTAIEKDYSTLLRLVDDEGHVIVEASHFVPGNYATSNWIPDAYLIDDIEISIPPGTLAGTYMMQLSLVDAINGQYQNVLDSGGNPVGVQVAAGAWSYTNQRPWSAMAMRDYFDLPERAIRLENGLMFLQLRGLGPQAMVGDLLTLKLFWNYEGPPEADWTRYLLWLDADGKTVHESDLGSLFEKMNDSWPGGSWYDFEDIYIPADMPAGVYQLGLEIRTDTAVWPIPLDNQIEIKTPERFYDLPENIRALDVRWENGIQLKGYEQRDDTLILYWQNQRALDRSLRLFVQAFEGSNMIAQTDGVPVNWQRPTSGWLSGEVIRSEHALGAEWSRYPVRIGWYDPQDGQRIFIESTDEDYWVLDPDS